MYEGEKGSVRAGRAATGAGGTTVLVLSETVGYSIWVILSAPTVMASSYASEESESEAGVAAGGRLNVLDPVANLFPTAVLNKSTLLTLLTEDDFESERGRFPIGLVEEMTPDLSTVVREGEVSGGSQNDEVESTSVLIDGESVQAVERESEEEEV